MFGHDVRPRRIANRVDIAVFSVKPSAKKGVRFAVHVGDEVGDKDVST